MVSACRFRGRFFLRLISKRISILARVIVIFISGASFPCPLLIALLYYELTHIARWDNAQKLTHIFSYFVSLLIAILWYNRSKKGVQTLSTEAEKRAVANYQKKRDNIMIRPDKETGAQIRQAAADAGQSVQQYILQAVMDRVTGGKM